jgi:predicted amidohydrolase
MKIYGIQLSSEWNQKEKNFKKVKTLLEKHKVIKNSLLVLPEMFATGFNLDPPATMAEEPHKTESFLSQLAKEKKCWIIGGMIKPEKNQKKGKNCSVLFSPEGERKLSYTKIHPIPMLGEDEVHVRGDKVKSVPIEFFQISTFICYDLRFPELFRSSLKQGTNLFVVIACWPKTRIQHWSVLLRARAIENQAYVVGLNRTGKDPGLEYGGHSMVIDPMGNILVEGGEEEGLIEAEIEKNTINEWRSEFSATNDYLNYN